MADEPGLTRRPTMLARLVTHEYFLLREPGPLEIVIARSAGGPGSPLLALGRFPLPATAETAAALAAANGADRRARAKKYLHLADRCRCLAAGALVRAVAGADPLADRDGRPYFPESPDRRVTIAHSGPWAACAFHDGPVGIDVEDLAMPAEPGMAAAFMSPAELSAYDALDGALARQAYFFDVWTAKEAFIKAVGGPVRFAPESLTVNTEPGLNIRRETLPGGFRLALVWKDRRSVSSGIPASRTPADERGASGRPMRDCGPFPRETSF